MNHLSGRKRRRKRAKDDNVKVLCRFNSNNSYIIFVFLILVYIFSIFWSFGSIGRSPRI
eukprot:UN17316